MQKKYFGHLLWTFLFFIMLHSCGLDPIGQGAKDVNYYLVTNDSARAVFTGDVEKNAVEKIYAISMADGMMTTLFDNSDIENFSRFMISPDSSTVVYLESGKIFRLHSVSIDGLPIATLWNNPLLQDNLTIFSDMAISNDSDTVVFRGDIDVPDVTRLYTIPITGGSLTTLSNNTGTELSLAVSEFVISPDSARVVFMGDPEVDDVVRLYSVPITGGDITTLSPNTGVDTTLDVDTYAISPDGSTVVFMGDPEVDDVVRLYSVPITGGDITTLSPNTGVDTTLDVDTYAISPDGSMVVFMGDPEVDDVVRLYSVPITGGDITTLSPNTGVDTALDVDAYAISPDGATVVFGGDVVVDNASLLFSIPIHGGEAIELTSKATGNFAISSDSARIVFLGKTETENVFRLASVSIIGGTTTELSHDVGSNDKMEILDYALGSDASRVVFRGDTEVDEMIRLYSVPIAGGEITTLFTTDSENVTPFDFTITPDGTKVLYRLEVKVGNHFENTRLYSAPIGGGEITRLSQN